MDIESFDIYLTEMGIGKKARQLIIKKFEDHGERSYVDGSNACYKVLHENFVKGEYVCPPRWQRQNSDNDEGKEPLF